MACLAGCMRVTLGHTCDGTGLSLEILMPSAMTWHKLTRSGVYIAKPLSSLNNICAVSVGNLVQISYKFYLLKAVGFLDKI